ncbi:hypothetical protein [Aliarcobacter vitoriensis]|nr:hypothetical protein [Aliarcobacter vitoriensis]
MATYMEKDVLIEYVGGAIDLLIKKHKLHIKTCKNTNCILKHARTQIAY